VWLIKLGIQCHTAPFSWKLVFECDHQLYEIILSACSPKEELEWRSRLTERFCKEHNDVFEHCLFTSLSLEIKPLGTVFGKPGKIVQSYSKSPVIVVRETHGKQVDIR
jgi:hypothetical protein